MQHAAIRYLREVLSVASSNFAAFSNTKRAEMRFKNTRYAESVGFDIVMWKWRNCIVLYLHKAYHIQRTQKKWLRTEPMHGSQSSSAT